jgi:hypothetical protein
MRKLKCAVGYNGRFVFLERFPNDEEHAGLVIEGEGESAVLEIETLEVIK